MMKKKYFGTDGIRGRVGQSKVTPEFVLKLGWAVGRVLANNEMSKVLIGKDTRISGYMLESALEAGLSAAGCDIKLLGPMPTPAIAYLTQTFRANAGIVISASHNPYYDNGIKFFNQDGTKFSDEMELAIEAEMDKPLITVNPENLGKAARIDDAAGRYIEFCKSCFPVGVRLQQLKIVVDCAHGATYHIAPSVFKELGAKVIKIGVEPDGFNINYECGSTSPASLAERVKQENADIGFAFDGDGDRVTIVDEKGNVVDGDHILYVIARNKQAQGELIPGVVGTVMSNIGLELSLKQRGIDFYRADVGDRHVSKALTDLGWTLGGESSGHIICRDKTTTGDGIIAALQVLAAMKQTNQKLSALTNGMKKCPQALVNIETSQAISVLGSNQVIDLQQKLERAMQGAGRILLRASGTEPLIRVMVQGESISLVESACKEMVAMIEQQTLNLA